MLADTCPTCHGTGSHRSRPVLPCPACQGRGHQLPAPKPAPERAASDDIDQHYRYPGMGGG